MQIFPIFTHHPFPTTWEDQKNGKNERCTSVKMIMLKHREIIKHTKRVSSPASLKKFVRIWLKAFISRKSKFLLQNLMILFFQDDKISVSKVENTIMARS